MQDNKIYYPNLINARKDKYTQKQLAEEIGINQQEISRYERGEIKAPINYLIDVAKACNVSLDYITGLSEKEKEKLTDDERKIIELWNQLSERNKGKVEFLIEQLQEEQAKAKEVI